MAKHMELKHMEEENAKLKAKIVNLQTQNETDKKKLTALKGKEEELATKVTQLNKQIEQLDKQIAEVKEKAKSKAPVPTPAPAPSKKPQTEPKAPTKAKKVETKRAVCSLEEAETGRRVSKVIKFFLDEAEKWNKSQTSRKITKIMRTKGDKQEIILEIADYAGLSGLTTFLGNRKYYRLCVDSFKLDKVDPPARGTYSVVVKESRMKQVYTTRGEKQYTICLKSYRELLKCSLQGTCTADQSAKWKKLYKECGDLVQKLEKQPKALRLFHAEVKQRRRKGELYSDAMARVASEIKSVQKVA